MNRETLKLAVALAADMGYALVATANKRGSPHVAVAGELLLRSGNRVLVRDWFCGATMANLNVNRHVAIVVWDKQNDAGFQLLGRTLRVEDFAILDGYVPDPDGGKAPPQVEREMTVQINRIVDFRHALHSDLEE
jgi:uncharacterized protein